MSLSPSPAILAINMVDQKISLLGLPCMKVEGQAQQRQEGMLAYR